MYHDCPPSLLRTVSITLFPPLKAVYVPRMLPSESLLALGYVPGPKATEGPALTGTTAFLLVIVVLTGAAEDALKKRAATKQIKVLDVKNIFV